MDKVIFDSLIGRKVQLINDENFVIKGRIKAVTEDTVIFSTDNGIRYLSFRRIKEVRLL